MRTTLVLMDVHHQIDYKRSEKYLFSEYEFGEDMVYSQRL